MSDVNRTFDGWAEEQDPKDVYYDALVNTFLGGNADMAEEVVRDTSCWTDLSGYEKRSFQKEHFFYMNESQDHFYTADEYHAIVSRNTSIMRTARAMLVELKIAVSSVLQYSPDAYTGRYVNNFGGFFIEKLIHDEVGRGLGHMYSRSFKIAVTGALDERATDISTHYLVGVFESDAWEGLLMTWLDQQFDPQANEDTIYSDQSLFGFSITQPDGRTKRAAVFDSTKLKYSQR